ncbi:MAG: CHASE2 domain-containing protein, partial [Pseudomonadales bacterium]
MCAAVLLLQFSPLGDFSSRAMYDLGTKFYSGTANNRISVIAIDEKSLAHLGRWPWNREYHAALIEKLSTVSPKVIGYPVFFVEPQRD